MFVAVINRSHVIERVFFLFFQKICENWATDQANQISDFTNEIDTIRVGEIYNVPNTDIYISVCESERF